MTISWDRAVIHALELAGTQLGASYGKPAVKVVANGRAFLFTSHEYQTSFGLALDLDTIEMLKETDSATFWQTPHYEGWTGVLVRYDTSDPGRVMEYIKKSRDWVAGKPKVRPRRSS